MVSGKFSASSIQDMNYPVALLDLEALPFRATIFGDDDVGEECNTLSGFGVLHQDELYPRGPLRFVVSRPCKASKGAKRIWRGLAGCKDSDYISSFGRYTPCTKKEARLYSGKGRLFRDDGASTYISRISIATRSPSHNLIDATSSKFVTTMSGIRNSRNATASWTKLLGDSCESLLS